MEALLVSYREVRAEGKARRLFPNAMADRFTHGGPYRVPSMKPPQMNLLFHCSNTPRERSGFRRRVGSRWIIGILAGVLMLGFARGITKASDSTTSLLEAIDAHIDLALEDTQLTPAPRCS